MSLRKALNEVKKDNKKNGKMLNQLHDLDNKIEDFIQKLEAKIDAVKDNPTFQQKAHNLLADMSREYAEFIIALRAVVNAVDRKSQIVPKWERQPSKIRDVHKDDGNGMEEPPPEAEPKEESTKLREALGCNRDYKARDKAFMKAAKEKGLIDLWECPECGRKNLKKFSECPRCKAKMPTK
jgi:hypothetical protein